MLRPIRPARHTSELALIKAGARRTHSLDQLAIDRQRNRRNSCLFDRARQQAHRLMTKFGGRNQERSLHVVVLYPIDQFRRGDLSKARGVGNESAETPESRIKLADYSVGFKLEQSPERNLGIHVFADEGLVIATTGKLQIARINFGGDFAKRDVAVGLARIKWLSAIHVRAGRADEREIPHR